MPSGENGLWRWFYRKTFFEKKILPTLISTGYCHFVDVVKHGTLLAEFQDGIIQGRLYPQPKWPRAQICLTFVTEIPSNKNYRNGV